MTFNTENYYYSRHDNKVRKEKNFCIIFGEQNTAMQAAHAGMGQLIVLYLVLLAWQCTVAIFGI